MKPAWASLLIGLGVVAAAIAAGSLRTAANAQSSTPTIDRTFVCAPALRGGIPEVESRAYRRSVRSGTSWTRPAFADVSTSLSASGATSIENELAWVTAGRPSPEANVGSWPGFTFPMRSWGTVAVNLGPCRGSTKKVALGRSGLQGGPAGVLDERWECGTGRRVLVRVRATMTAPTRLSSFRGFLRTTVPARAASLAVQSESGRRLVFAQVLESGKALLYTSPSCYPD
jgi:hypothetical protein